MDPAVCFQRILEAIEADDLPEAFAGCRDLQRWLERGGFPPTGVSLQLVRQLGQMVGDTARYREIQLLTQAELF